MLNNTRSQNSLRETIVIDNYGRTNENEERQGGDRGGMRKIGRQTGREEGKRMKEKGGGENIERTLDEIFLFLKLM